VHNNNLRTEEVMVKQITWEVRTRIISKGSFKKLNKCIELVISWNLQKLLVYVCCFLVVMTV